MVSVAYTLWVLTAKYPDSRILIMNADLELPRKWVGEMEGYCRENPVLRWVFPEMCPQGTPEEIAQWGYIEKFTIPSKTATSAEASVEISSVKNRVTGKRFDLIVFDDLVNDENINTEGGMRAVQRAYVTCPPESWSTPRESLFGQNGQERSACGRRSTPPKRS